MLCPINDLFKYLKEDKIKLVPLRDYDKRPLHNGFYDKNYPLQYLEKHQGNLGICPGYNHEKNKVSLAVVDIDGLNGEYKKESQEYLMSMLKDIPGSMMIQTQSGGYHLYFWNKTVLSKFHDSTKNLCFPEDCPIPQLVGKPLEHSIEIFTKWHTKYVVLPGSLIKTTDNPNIREYCIINNINNLSDITVVDDVGELIQKTLLDKGFTIEENSINKSSESIADKITKNHDFKKEESKELIRILTPCFKELTGARQDSYMALSNYLLTYLPEKTTTRIIRNLAINTGDEEVEKRVGTVKRNSEHEGNKTGLPTILENLKPKGFNIKGLEFNIRKLVQKNYTHEIILEEGYKNKKYLNLDFNNRVKDNESGEFYYAVKNKEPILNLSVESVFESYNILDKNTPPKLCFKFYRKGMPKPITLVGDDIIQIEKELSTFSGIVLKPRKYKGLLNIIVSEYENLGLLKQQFNAPVTGLFINPVNKQLEWCVNTTYECENSGLIPDLNKIKPSKEEVYDGLDVWKRLGDHYKGDNTKLSHIIRWGILVPFSYILKQLQEYVPMIFLYGVSNTSKTMLAEISLCLYNKIDDNNSLGGLACSTVYQAGNSFEKTTLGSVINEPGNVLDNPNILDIFKRGSESTICREKMGTNGKHMRVNAYNNFIWTSNNYVPSNDAFIKRTDYLEFTKNDQMTEEDKEAFVKEFNHINWNSTDFLKLRKVGDFIVNYVYNNTDLLYEKHDDIVNTLLNELYKYSNHEPIKWLYEKAIIKGFEDTDNDVLDELRSMILNDYNKMTQFKNTAQFNNTELEEIGIYSTNHEKEFRNNIIGLISSKRILYLWLNKNKEGELFIIFSANVGKELNKYSHGDLKVTGKVLASLFDKEYKSHKTLNLTVKKGFKLSLEEFMEFLG